MSSSWRVAWRWAAVPMAAVVLLFLPGFSRPAAALDFGERLQVSGNLELMNILRTPKFRQAEFISQRNTLNLRVDWDWAVGGKALDKYDLPFILLSDPDHAVAEAYGAWAEKKSFGKTYEGITRSHLSIDRQGRVVEAKRKVKPESTADLALHLIEL